MKLDDIALWTLFKENNTNFNCGSILSRDHIRKIHSTSETPTKKDERKAEKNKEKLSKKGIWFYEDKAENLWYKFNVDDKENKEIMIINDDGKAYPLSKDSSIVKNMGAVKQIRIYVKSGDREVAEEALK